MYHPRYLVIEKCIRYFWKDKKESLNDSPGNDIANFTHLFAGAMTDKLTEMCSRVDKHGRYYSILFEWGMRELNGPLQTMIELKQIGYNNIVLFVATPCNLSYNACELRADIMKKGNRIFRKVPNDFHDVCIKTLPNSINVIYDDGYKSKLIDHMAIVSRDGKIIWDCNSKEKPGNIYNTVINSDEIIYTNDVNKALVSNNIESVGLIKDKEKLVELRETLVCLAPNLFISGLNKRI